MCSIVFKLSACWFVKSFVCAGARSSSLMRVAFTFVLAYVFFVCIGARAWISVCVCVCAFLCSQGEGSSLGDEGAGSSA